MNIQKTSTLISDTLTHLLAAHNIPIANLALIGNLKSIICCFHVKNIIVIAATSGPGAQMANLASQNILKGSGEGVTQITLMNRAGEMNTQFFSNVYFSNVKWSTYFVVSIISGQKNANGVLMGSLYSQQLVNGATECVLNLDVLNQLQSG